MNTRNIAKGLLGVVLAVGLVTACASTPEPEPPSDEGFQEAPRDPGLPDRDRTPPPRDVAEFQTIFFAFDEYSLTGRAKDSLRHNAAVLSQSSGARLEIQGNCDERGTEEYNLALGKRRAEAAQQYLVDLGVEVSQVTTISFGEENPSVRASNETAWARNRRDDFLLR